MRKHETKRNKKRNEIRNEIETKRNTKRNEVRGGYPDFVHLNVEFSETSEELDALERSEAVDLQVERLEGSDAAHVAWDAVEVVVPQAELFERRQRGGRRHSGWR